MKTAHSWAVRPAILAALIAMVPGAWQVAAHAEGWELKTSEGGVKVHAKAVEGSGVEMLKGTMDVPWSPAEVAEVIFDVDAQRNYLVGMQTVKVLGETTTKTGKRVRTVYQRSSHPGIDDREVVLKFTMWSKEGKKGEVWHVKFKRQKQSGEPKDGVVRIEKLDGGWTISPHPSGKGSRIVYRCHAEIGGNLPDFVMNAGQGDNLLEMFASARAQMKKKIGAPK